MPGVAARGAGIDRVPVRGLFQLRLAELRFAQAGLAAEVYAGTAAELDWILGFAPSAEHPPMVHLDRSVNILRPADRATVAGIADRFAGRISRCCSWSTPPAWTWTGSSGWGGDCGTPRRSASASTSDTSA